MNHKDTENGSGNVWIIPIENALDCTLKNGPCTLNPGDAIQMNYTTHIGLSAGLVGVLSYPNSGVESGELDLTYSNYSEAGNYKCPKIRFIGTSGTAPSYTSDSGSITVQ